MGLKNVLKRSKNYLIFFIVSFTPKLSTVSIVNYIIIKRNLKMQQSNLESHSGTCCCRNEHNSMNKTKTVFEVNFNVKSVDGK